MRTKKKKNQIGWRLIERYSSSISIFFNFNNLNFDGMLMETMFRNDPTTQTTTKLRIDLNRNQSLRNTNETE